MHNSRVSNLKNIKCKRVVSPPHPQLQFQLIPVCPVPMSVGRSVVTAASLLIESRTSSVGRTFEICIRHHQSVSQPPPSCRMSPLPSVLPNSNQPPTAKQRKQQQQPELKTCLSGRTEQEQPLEWFWFCALSLVTGPPTAAARNATPISHPGSPLHLYVEFCANPPAFAARWLHGDRIYTPGNQYGVDVLAYAVQVSTNLSSPWKRPGDSSHLFPWPKTAFLDSHVLILLLFLALHVPTLSNS